MGDHDLHGILRLPQDSRVCAMSRPACIQVVVLMLAMSFALAESNSAPDWVGGCIEPKECPKECKIGDKSHTECAWKCAHKWEYSSQKGPYKCSTSSCQGEEEARSSKFWCTELQTNTAEALRSVTGFPKQKNEVKQDKICMPSAIPAGIKSVRVKFMENEPHRKYETDTKSVMSNQEAGKMQTSWSSDEDKTGNGIEMHPWVTPGVSNCSPDTKTPAGDFIKYFEALKLHAHDDDKIGTDCYKIGRKEKNGLSTAEALRNAGRCKFNIAGKKWCLTEQSFFCAKAYALTTTVYDKIRVDKMKKDGKRKGKSKYFYLQIQLTMKMKKANMCERMWRHLPYTCSVQKMTEPILVVVKSCKTYDGGRDSKGNPYKEGGRNGDNSGAPPNALCDHYKKYFPKGHQMNIGMPDFKAIPDFKGSVSGSWKGFTNPAPSIPHVAAIEAALKGFLSTK